MKEKTFKDVEGMLYSYNKLLAEVKDIEFEIEEIIEQTQGISHSRNEIKESTNTYRITSPVENEVIKKDEQINHLKLIKSSKERQAKRIKNMLSILNDEDNKFIELKYMKKMRCKNIEVELGLTRDGVNSRRKVIITSLVDFINNTKNTQKII